MGRGRGSAGRAGAGGERMNAVVASGRGVLDGAGWRRWEGARRPASGQSRTRVRSRVIELT